MSASLPLAGLKFSISGSAGDTSIAPVDRALLQRCHSFVRALTQELLKAGGEMVVFVGNEPRLSPEDPNTSKVFGWTELEAIATHLPDRASTHSGRPLLHAVVAADLSKRRIPQHRASLWDQLLAEDGAIRQTPIAERFFVGGHQRERQAEQADVLIALGGGKGIFDLDHRFRERGGVILPLDARIGSSCNDGEASPELNREALERPERFVPAADADWFAQQLPRLSFYGGASPEELAQRVLQVLLRVVPRAPQRPLPPEAKGSLSAVSPAASTAHATASTPRRPLPAKVHFLVLADEWWPHKGGISSFNRDFCTALARAGHRVSLFIPRRALIHEEREEISRIPGLTLVESGQKSVAPEHELLFRPQIEGSPDVIIGHGMITGPMALAQRQQHFANSTLVHIVHVSPNDTEHAKGKDAEDAMTDSEAKDREQTDFASDADLIVAVGPKLERSIQQSLHRWDKHARVHMLLPWLHDMTPSRPPIEPACLFIGRAASYHLKGLRIAAGAVARLGNRPRLYVRGATHTDARELQQKLESWSEGGVEVRLQEYTPEQARIDASFRDATAVLMPSRTEGFGLVGLEAIMRGIPLLASAESGLAEVLLQYGGEPGRAAVVQVGSDEDENIARFHERLAGLWRTPEAAFAQARDLYGRLRPHLDAPTSIRAFVAALQE